MSDWTVELELVDDKSSKFWRARTEGSDLVINYGRIGSNGQTKTKSFDDPSDALAELDKVAASKRKKGYAATAAAAPVAPAPPPQDDAADDDGPSGPVSLTLEQGGRTISVTLEVKDGMLRTEVVEGYPGEKEATAGLRRIQQALVDEGYR